MTSLRGLCCSGDMTTLQGGHSRPGEESFHFYLAAKETEAKSTTCSFKLAIGIGPLGWGTAHSTAGPLPQGPQMPTPTELPPLSVLTLASWLGAASHSLADLFYAHAHAHEPGSSLSP